MKMTVIFRKRMSACKVKIVNNNGNVVYSKITLFGAQPTRATVAKFRYIYEFVQPLKMKYNVDCVVYA